MPGSGLADFIAVLKKSDEIHQITSFVDPILEITEITDRIVKSGGKALLFENTGTKFPLLINAYGSEKRMALALNRKDLDEAASDIDSLFKKFLSAKNTFIGKISALPSLITLSGYLPSYKSRRGVCQEVVHSEPDLSILPVLKCWPHDGGKFVTLPVVHTVNPLTGARNAGMYRMQILDRKSAAIHWQRHKTGANHFEAWKKEGRRMPVSVVLGGDPVYAYAATAPLPENIDEYILAGFLRKKRVKMVKCLTNELYVPYDADIVIEGFVDPAEDPVLEGPFGDHTGFYSLADFYPRMHVTCITHSRNAVYPATIVGIPPMEDAWFAMASEKIFLHPLKLALLPEIEDFHMPEPGVAHNLLIVKINKTYPGQGRKVINSLLGAGQMMFTKYLVVVSGEADIRNYKNLAEIVFRHFNFSRDLQFMTGPLDVLDHAADRFTFGGKLGIDATVKLPEEQSVLPDWQNSGFVVLPVNQFNDPFAIKKAKAECLKGTEDYTGKVVLAVDSTVDVSDLYLVAWQILGNSDPVRDAELLDERTLFIDGTIKAYRDGGFARKWPNVVVSAEDTVRKVDSIWNSLGIGKLLLSPSTRYSRLSRPGNDMVIPDS